MMALAGYPLGLQFRFLDPSPEAPAGQLAEHLVGDYEDLEALGRFVQGLDVCTYEFENVPKRATSMISEHVPMLPGPEALGVAQDRLTEKSFFNRNDIGTAPYKQVDSYADLRGAVADIGLPAILKTRRMGYDGKGQVTLREQADIDRAWTRLGNGDGTPELILEGQVPFSRELSIVAVRGDHETLFYPLIENHHYSGILRLSLAPAQGQTDDLQARAESYATRILDALNYRGVLAIELFQVGDELLANEMAPRVHNSGHWTIEGAYTSQFENHLRAVLGMPLGFTAMQGHAAMLNIIGELPGKEAIRQILSTPRAHLHLYGKSPRPDRKLGHVTLTADEPGQVEQHMRKLAPLFTEGISR
ncbi:MAG: 5-(carboxyamino)imidazole ribonucleotide synthase [Chloroflexota bacterium]|nr:5-(carboxyamino)imidazole ribonucleotide synthase [Chloroflexota bacterium]